MVARAILLHHLSMSSSPDDTCCGRAMTGIEVSRTGSHLSLHTCAACGQHAWRRDGQALARSGLLAAVRDCVLAR